MKRFAAILALSLIWAPVAFADNVKVYQHYEVTPLTKADLDLYLSVMHTASAYVINPKGEDKAALAYMKANHGDPKLPPPPKTPDFGNRAPTMAELNAILKAQNAYNKRTQKQQEYMSRAIALSSYDEEIAKQRHLGYRYDAIKNAVEQAMAVITQTGAGSCGGDDCGPAHPTAAQIALWKKESEVENLNIVFLKPHAAEIEKLKRPMHDIMFGH